ncbi:MAG: hypothetical protein R3C68_15515 [Myxococcota bacterium]
MHEFRQAHSLDPKDETIAYDLARLSFENEQPTLSQDAAGFLAIEPTTPDAHLLRAYLLLRQGDKTHASTHIQHVLAIRPTDPEALQLHALVAPALSSATPLNNYSIRLATATQIDSNVTVLPRIAQVNKWAFGFSSKGLCFTHLDLPWRASTWVWLSPGALCQ